MPLIRRANHESIYFLQLFQFQKLLTILYHNRTQKEKANAKQNAFMALKRVF